MAISRALSRATTVYADAAATTAALALKANASALVFSKSYESAEQTITLAALLTLAHGLGSVPKSVQVWAKCIAIDSGYAIGDVLLLDGSSDGVSSASGNGLAITVDATNVKVRTGNGNFVGILLDKVTGVAVTPAPANWKLIVRAYA